MSLGIRRLALTAHVAVSVGWLGAVAGFLALAIVGLTSPDEKTALAAYLATDLVTWWVIVPLSLASLATGIVQSLGTRWGLFRHYWVLAKLLLTVVATALLLLHTGPIGHLAKVAAEGAPFDSALDGLRIQLIADAGGGILVLLLVVALSVFKPRGMTPYGQRKQRERRAKLARRDP
ncbi:DUF2269 domain-containing protein [Homoserinimonas sp. A447]